MSTIIMNLRGARVTPIHRGSVLLSKQEDLCSTNYIYMVTCACVRGSTLAQFDTVLVLLFEGRMATSGEPSTWFPLG